MRSELDRILCEKYPVIFKDRRASPDVTCMYWGFRHGDGWFHIVDGLCQGIQSHIDNRIKQIIDSESWNKKVNDPNHEWVAFVERKEREIPKPVPQVIAVQVKEKFGGLRFYYTGGDDYINGMVRLAEIMSYRTCEKCGNIGEYKRRDRGYIQTLCDNCYID